MKFARVTLLLAIWLLLNIPLPTDARPVRIWNHDELVQRAELVVIATVRSTGDEKGFDPNSIAPGTITFVPVDTVFDVQAVVKGQFSGKMLTIRHDRYSGNGLVIIDGPGFITFDPKKRNQYLIYLKKSGDHYEPLTGHFDPWQSFYQIQIYDWSHETIATHSAA